MGWIDRLQAVQAMDLGEPLLREAATASTTAGEVARGAALALPFGASPVDFVREFTKLAGETPRE